MIKDYLIVNKRVTRLLFQGGGSPDPDGVLPVQIGQ